jgi:inorganic pyrophosphatase
MSPRITFDELEPIDDDGRVRVVIDTPKGSRNKFKYDDKLGLFKLGKVLPMGAYFPFDFGFLPGTRGEDGDALDVLVLMVEPAFTGCLVPARLVGVIEAEQTEKGKTIRNDRLVAVVETPYNPAAFRKLFELGETRLGEIEHFFVAYNDMEGRQFRPTGRAGPDRAEHLVEEGIRFRHEKSKKPNKATSRARK